MPKDIKCVFGVDVDAVGGWLGSYGGEDSPSDIQRGMFSGQVGTPRLLKLFKRYDLPASWFIPGHSIETFPDQVKMIVDQCHEIGAHGYSHENPIAMTAKQEEDVISYCVELIEKISGRAPRGYVAPWWEMSNITASLLQKYGFTYDHSQGFHDFVPFYARVGDTWTKIDYSQEARVWMKPLVRGQVIDLVEIGANWYMDDLPPMMFIKKAPNSAGWVNPRDVEQWWRDQFDWVYREQDYGVFAFTIHPDVSGRPQVLFILERLIEYINGHEGMTWVTMEDAANDFRRRYPYPGPDGNPFMRGRDAAWRTGGQPARSTTPPYTFPGVAAQPRALRTPLIDRLREDPGSVDPAEVGPGWPNATFTQDRKLLLPLALPSWRAAKGFCCNPTTLEVVIAAA